MVTVLDAVTRDLASVGKRKPELADGTLAATAMALAAEIDDPTNSATSKSMCAARLVEVMQHIRELAPDAREENPLDEIRARRDRKQDREPAPQDRDAAGGRKITP